MAIASRHVETILFSAAVTVNNTTFSSDFAPGIDAKGARFYLNVLTVVGTLPTIDVKVQGKTPQGNYFDLGDSAMTQVTTGDSTTEEMLIYPGIAETAGETVSDVLPGEFRAVADIGGGTAVIVTFSLNAEYLT
jgi:hypothetical protein